MLPIERQNSENLKSLIATLADPFNWDEIRVKPSCPDRGVTPPRMKIGPVEGDPESYFRTKELNPVCISPIFVLG